MPDAVAQPPSVAASAVHVDSCDVEETSSAAMPKRVGEWIAIDVNQYVHVVGSTATAEIAGVVKYGMRWAPSAFMTFICMFQMPPARELAAFPFATIKEMRCRVAVALAPGVRNRSANGQRRLPPGPQGRYAPRRSRRVRAFPKPEAFAVLAAT